MICKRENIGDACLNGENLILECRRIDRESILERNGEFLGERGGRSKDEK